MHPTDAAPQFGFEPLLPKQSVNAAQEARGSGERERFSHAPQRAHS